MVTRRGEVAGVILGRCRQGGGTVLPWVQRAGLASGGEGGFHQRCVGKIFLSALVYMTRQAINRKKTSWQ